MKYRSRTDIMDAVLRAANKGATRTRIMYAAYLSFAQANEYLKHLTAKGLLHHDVTTGRYQLTEKGLHYLSILEEIKQVTDFGEESPREGEEYMVPSIRSSGSLFSESRRHTGRGQQAIP